MRKTKYLKLPLIPEGLDSWASLYWDALETIDRLGGYLPVAQNGSRISFNALSDIGSRIPGVTLEPADSTVKISIGGLNDEIWINGKPYIPAADLATSDWVPGTYIAKGMSVSYKGLRFICDTEHITQDTLAESAYNWRPASRDVLIVHKVDHEFEDMNVLASVGGAWVKASVASPNTIPQPPFVVVEKGDDYFILSGPGLFLTEGYGEATHYLTSGGATTVTAPAVGFSCPVFRSIGNAWISVLDARPVELI